MNRRSIGNSPFNKPHPNLEKAQVTSRFDIHNVPFANVDGMSAGGNYPQVQKSNS